MNEVFHLPTILNASKNLSYKKQVLEKCTAIFQFYKENGLIKIDPMDSEGVVKPDLVVLVDDLTENGLAVWRIAFAKWSKARDKDGNFKNMKIFEAALSEVAAGSNK